MIHDTAPPLHTTTHITDSIYIYIYITNYSHNESTHNTQDMILKKQSIVFCVDEYNKTKYHKKHTTGEKEAHNGISALQKKRNEIEHTQFSYSHITCPSLLVRLCFILLDGKKGVFFCIMTFIIRRIILFPK